MKETYLNFVYVQAAFMTGVATTLLFMIAKATL